MALQRSSHRRAILRCRRRGLHTPPREASLAVLSTNSSAPEGIRLSCGSPRGRMRGNPAGSSLLLGSTGWGAILPPVQREVDSKNGTPARRAKRDFCKCGTFCSPGHAVRRANVRLAFVWFDRLLEHGSRGAVRVYLQRRRSGAAATLCCRPCSRSTSPICCRSFSASVTGPVNCAIPAETAAKSSLTAGCCCSVTKRCSRSIVM